MSLQVHNRPVGRAGREAASDRTDSVAARGGSEWLTSFAKAARLGDRLRLLVDFGLTDRDIAKATPGAAARSIRRWRTEGPPATKASERWEPIDDLFTIISLLLADGSYDNEGVVAWLRSRHRALDNRRPLDVLGEGDFSAVIGAAEQTLTPRGVPEEDSFFATHPGHRADTPPSDRPSQRRSARTRSKQTAEDTREHLIET